MANTISAQSLTDRTFDKFSDRQKHLATIAALEAQGDLFRLEPAVTAALEGGVTINEIKEAFSQLYAYTGFPRSLNALGVLNKVIESGNGKYNEGKPWTRPAMWDDAKQALEIGTEVQTQLSGRPFNYDFCPQNDYYLKSHLFGDIFAGDLLTPADREIVTVAALSALKGVAPQLAAHKAGAVNMGNTQERVDELCKFLSDNGLSQCDASADAQTGSWPKGNPNDTYAQYDAEKVGIIGICGWGGIALNAAAIDPRIKATAVMTMYDMSRVNGNGYFDAGNSEEARLATRKALADERMKAATTGNTTPGGGVVDPLPEDAPQFVKDYYDYYKAPRGYHVRSGNSNDGWHTFGCQAYANTRFLYYINEIRNAVLIVHGSEAHSRYFGENAYQYMMEGKAEGYDAVRKPNPVPENKELLIIPGASHCDLYDGGKDKVIPWDKLETFFNTNM